MTIFPALSTFSITALAALAALVVIVAVVLRNRNTKFTSIADNDQPATGALPTPPVGADDEPVSNISRKPPAPIFIVAVPRDPHTLDVSFALPPGTPTPDGVEILVNESERHDFPPQDEYVIEGVEPGAQVSVQVRTYYLLEGGDSEPTFSDYATPVLVTMPNRARNDSVLIPRDMHLPVKPGYPFDFLGYGGSGRVGYDIFDIIELDRTPSPTLDARDPLTVIDDSFTDDAKKRDGETERERAMRVYGDFKDENGNGVDDRFEQDALARLADEGGIIKDDDIHNTHPNGDDKYAPTPSAASAPSVEEDESGVKVLASDDDDTARFDAEGGAQTQGSTFVSPGNRTLKTDDK